MNTLLGRWAATMGRWAATMEAWGLFRFIRALEPLAILVVIVAFFNEFSYRHEERAARAWQLLTISAPGNSGKIEALEYLNSREISLAQIELSPPILAKQWERIPKNNRELEGCEQFTYLRGVKLPQAYLSFATLACADLYGADLRGADLDGADLRGAILKGADLRGAYLQGAQLKEALLPYADLRGAHLIIQDSPVAKVNIRYSDMQKVACSELRQAKNWKDAYRDEELACGKPIPPAPISPLSFAHYGWLLMNHGMNRMGLTRLDDLKEKNEAIRTAESVQRDPAASLIERARDDAILELQARAWFSIGYLYSEKGDLEKSMDAYTKAIRLNPNNFKAYYNRGIVKSYLDQHEAAIVDYDQAIRLNPALADLYTNRGNAKNKLGQYEAAIADYDQAIRLNPNNPLAYNNRGNTKRALGRINEAREDYQQALVLAQEDNEERPRRKSEAQPQSSRQQ